MELYVLSAIDLRILIQIYIDGAVHWYSAVPRPRRYELGINVSSRASLGVGAGVWLQRGMQRLL